MSINIRYNLMRRWPAYSKGLWAFESTNKENVGFKYIIDVYSANTFIDRWETPPRPNDGFGIWNASELECFIDQSKDIYSDRKDWFSGADSFMQYRIVIGERYDRWNFFDNFYSLDAGTLGKVGFSSNTELHALEVGDQIVVFQDDGYTHQAYQGIANVISVPGPESIVVDKAFQTPTPAQGGYITKVNGASMVFTGVTSGQTSWLLGMTLDREKLENFNDISYLACTNPNARLLTDMPDEFTMREDARLFLSVPQFSGAVRGIRFITWDKSNQQVGCFEMPVNPSVLYTTPTMLYAACGPWDIASGNTTVSAVTGSTSFFDANVDSYTIQLIDSAGDKGSVTRRIYLDRTCEETEYNLLFMDKLGSFVTVSLTQGQEIEYNNKKKTFMNDGYGTMNGSTFTNDPAARGYTVFDSRQIKQFACRTKDMTEEESIYLASQLYSSPIVWWMKDPDLWYPVVIDDVTIPEQQFESDKFIEYEVKWSLAFNEPINW